MKLTNNLQRSHFARFESKCRCFICLYCRCYV